MVGLHGVAGQGYEPHTSLAELLAQLLSPAQLCGAHRGEVCRVGEQDSPASFSMPS